MKTLAELRVELRKLVEDKECTRIEYEVETNLDIKRGVYLGGIFFYDLSDAYEYLSSVLREQTDSELFECEVFKRIDYIQLTLHIENIDKFEIVKLVGYRRKNDTEFIEE